MKTMIEIHAVQNFAPSNLNRDDTGAPKDAFFGGTRRARISSQCFKRAMRQYFSEMVKQGLLAPQELAVRTKRVTEAIVKELVERGHGQAVADERVRLALAAIELPVKEDGKNEYLLFLGHREITDIAAAIHHNWKVIGELEKAKDDGKNGAKGKKRAAQNADPELKKALEKVLDGGKALDVALFGRMLADMPEKNQDAACQVAHAISTHAVEREFDFYTAVDDLKPEDTAGADMMGTIEFNSACFYRYGLVDWDKLVNNLQGDAELAAKGLRAFLEAFVLSEPEGKQNTFAAHNPPEFVAVSVRRNAAPRNFANAFEAAVRISKNESLTKKSADELVKKAKTLHAAFGGEEKTLILNVAAAHVEGFGKSSGSFSDLLDGVLESVRE